MLKNSLLIAVFFFSTTVFGQKSSLNASQNNELISSFMQLSLQQIYDTANYYHFKNSVDTALIAFTLFSNTVPKNSDVEYQIKVVNALNRTGIIYSNMSDYRNAYKYLIDALRLCEKHHISNHIFKPYNNLGTIYIMFNKFDIAKDYYYQALSVCEDTAAFDHMYNNIGYLELKSGNYDTAYYYLNKSLKISEKYNTNRLASIYNSMALLYQKTKQYDSAFHYYQSSLAESRKTNQVVTDAQTLSDLGNLFFEMNKIDSALFYINLSNTLTNENNISRIMAENYLILSKIEELRGRTKNAFNYYKTYAQLKDSILNAEKYGEINQLQHLYEISKTNEQIEQLLVEQQIKERTIRYQKMIWMITSCLLILVSIGLLLIYFQKRNLSRAYKVLFEKNLDIMTLYETSQEKHHGRYKKIALSDRLQNELLDKILTVMEDVSIICDVNFSIEKLAEQVQSNTKYVSQAINNTLKKNFRSFLNGYRIWEAQKLFSQPDFAKYTIESVALQVGFKSRNSFNEAFKDITGVSPGYYLKSIREQQ